MKFAQGNNMFRILGDAIAGWLDWTADDKPIRTPYDQLKPEPISSDREIKSFWAFPVWDYADNRVKVLEITQVSIMNALNEYLHDEAWGDPKNYDVVVGKTGEKLNTKYTIMAKPPKELCAEAAEAYMSTPLNLKALFKGLDPFAVDEK
jgi:hypothetical protein